MAQSYPSRQITLVVPFPAGSATDGVARRLADSLKEATGATVIVENKPGADGNLAALSVLRAEPDGYSVFVTTNSTHAANVNLFNSMPYDPKADFAPVAGIMTIPMMLTVKPDFPAKTVSEFIAVAKSQREAAGVCKRQHLEPRRGRAVQVARRHSDAARALSRHAAGHSPTCVGGQVEFIFADTSTGLGPVRDGGLARDRGDVAEAAGVVAGCPDDRRERLWRATSLPHGSACSSTRRRRARS